MASWIDELLSNDANLFLLLCSRCGFISLVYPPRPITAWIYAVTVASVRPSPFWVAEMLLVSTSP